MEIQNMVNQPYVGLLVANAVLFAMLVGSSVGFMAKLSGDTTVVALRRSGAAFTATVTVVLLIMAASGLLH
jgi:hypothetical protein